MSSGYSLAGSTLTISYCCSSSCAIAQRGFCAKVCMSKPPNSSTSVFSSPTFLRPAFDTVRMLRINSYSSGTAGPMNGVTTSLVPLITAKPRYIWMSARPPPGSCVVTCCDLMPKFDSAERASGEYGSG